MRRSLLLLILVISSCGSTRDLVLEDPVFRDDMIAGALSGEIFNINPDDYPEIHQLFSSSVPDEQLAGIILALQTEEPEFYPDIAAAALNGTPQAAEKARSVIKVNPEAFREIILALLEDPDPQRRSDALKLGTELGSQDIIPAMIEAFKDTDPQVREQASLSVHSVAERENPFLQKALNSSDPLTVSVAYRTLGRYANPEDAPLFVAGFSTPDTDIRRESQLAMLRLGESGLRHIHTAAANNGLSWRTRLSALEVIQGFRSTDSLPVLINLLADPNEQIGLKTESILGTYGEEAVEPLTELYHDGSDPQRIHAVRLMGEIEADSALPVLVSALDDPLTAQAAYSSLYRFGERAWPELHSRIGKLAAVQTAVILLREQSDPWLAVRDDGSPNTDTLLWLIRSSEIPELENYLDRVDFGAVGKETVMTLRTAWETGSTFAELEQRIAGDAYLNAWRQREINSVKARTRLEESFDQLHMFFETGDSFYLEQSRLIRADSRRFESEARRYKSRMDAMSARTRASGDIQLNQYKDIRNELVRTWEATVAELRPLAEAVYADHGIDPQTLALETTLLR